MAYRAEGLNDGGGRHKDIEGIVALLREVETHPSFDETDLSILENELAMALAEYQAAVQDAGRASALNDAVRLRGEVLERLDAQTGILSARPNLMEYFAKRQADLEGGRDELVPRPV